MESTNLQHQQLLASSTSSSSYILLNNGKTHERSQSEVPIIRDLISQKNEQLQDHPHVNHPMMMMMHHDMMMGIPSCPINPININNAHHDHDNAMTIIKDHHEVSYDSSSSSNLADMLSLKTCTHNHMIMNGVDQHHHHKYQFSQIFPSVNISNLSKSSSLSSPSLLSSSSSSSSSFMGMMNMDVCTSSMTSNPGLDHDAQHSSQLKLTRSHPNNNGDPQAKRPSTNVDSNKKPRFESRASCSPFKVRKEKLGDRVAALQQLVAPFGKTDTASVLMEAIGYIKFLQSQVQTLSIPYMKLSLHKSTGNIQQVSNEDRKKEEPTGLNLRSRGLCLVPLSCMSYITNDTGGGLWPPPPTLNPPRF